jgi:hypothetical protein
LAAVAAIIDHAVKTGAEISDAMRLELRASWEEARIQLAALASRTERRSQKEQLNRFVLRASDRGS